MLLLARGDTCISGMCLAAYSAHPLPPPSTVNSVCWAPHDYGLILACGSSDGAISLLSYTGEGQWEVKKINNAHTVSPGAALPQARGAGGWGGAASGSQSWNFVLTFEKLKAQRAHTR